MNELNNTPTPKYYEKPADRTLYIGEDTDFLIETIETNARGNFITKQSREIAKPDAQELEFQEWTVRSEYDEFQQKIAFYREQVAEDAPIQGDITFLEGCIKKLFIAYYRKDTPLVSIFESPEEKDKFYKLVRIYLLEGFTDTLDTNEKQYPKPFLTKEERDSLSSPNLPEWVTSDDTDAPQAEMPDLAEIIRQQQEGEGTK